MPESTWHAGDTIPADVDRVFDNLGDPWRWDSFTETWMYDCDLHRGCIEVETGDLLATYGPVTRWPVQLDLLELVAAS